MFVSRNWSFVVLILSEVWRKTITIVAQFHIIKMTAPPKHVRQLNIWRGQNFAWIALSIVLKLSSIPILYYRYCHSLSREKNTELKQRSFFHCSFSKVHDYPLCSILYIEKINILEFADLRWFPSSSLSKIIQIPH